MRPFLCVFMHTYAHINVLLISYMFFVVVAIIHINSILYLRAHNIILFMLRGAQSISALMQQYYATTC